MRTFEDIETIKRLEAEVACLQAQLNAKLWIGTIEVKDCELPQMLELRIMVERFPHLRLEYPDDAAKILTEKISMQICSALQAKGWFKEPLLRKVGRFERR